MPRIFKAPGVYRKEYDISDILIPTGISNGGVVVWSKKGPINRGVTVKNDKEYIDTFRKRIFTSGVKAAATQTSKEKLIPEYGYGAYAALEYLKESDTLVVVRAFKEGRDYYSSVCVTSTLTFASSAVSALNIVEGAAFDTDEKISSIDSFADSTGNASNKFVVGALGPGIDGNDIAVTIESFSTSSDWKYQYDNYPTVASATYTSAQTSAIASYYPIASKVFKMNVYVKANDKNWTDYYTNASDTSAQKLRLSPVETFYGSLDSDLKDADGNNLFIEGVINGNSQYVYVKKGVSFGNTFSYSTVKPNGTDGAGDYVTYSYLMTLNGGASYTPGYDALDSNSTSVFHVLKNREEIDVSIVIGTSYDTTYKQELAKIASSRLDCIVTNQVGEVDDEIYSDLINSELYGYTAPSYVALYGGYSKIYDKYNDKYVYLPNSIFGAALMARVDNIANPWDAPAGIDRATMAIIDQKKVYSETDIGEIYNKNINVPKFIRGVGNVMWGQKTAQLKKSALDRINVRRNLLYIENNCERSLMPFIFENNTVKTRLRVFSIIDEFLAGIKAAGGLTDYKVVCDETNNTSTIIDSNQMVVDIYVQPSRAIEFIQLNTIITRTGISFEQVRIATI